MSKNWVEYTLDEVCEEIVDCVNKTAPSVDYETEYKMIRTTNIKKGKIDTLSVRYVTEEIYNKWTRRSVPQIGDVILTREAPIGEVGMIKKDEKVFLGQRLMQYRANKEKLNPHFLLYSLQAPYLQHQILSHEGSGSTVSHIRVPEAMKFKIKVPPLKVQEKIAEILVSLDEKIEINLQINETLEEIARILYKSWFVDFSPFTDGEFKESELGSIPMGWRVSDIYELADVIYGAPFKSKLFQSNPEGLPIIRIRDLKTQNSAVYTTEVHPKQTIVYPGDLLVGMDGEFKATIWKGDIGLLNQRVCMFKPKENISKFYLVEAIKPYLEFYEKAKTGTTVIHLGKGDIDKMRVLIPSSKVLEDYFSYAEPMLEQILANAYEIKRLVDTRNYLLPRLLSGEIEVREGEKKIEGVL